MAGRYEYPSWAPGLREALDALKEESIRMCDNLERANVAQVVFLGLSEKDLANLKTLAEADGRVKNYAVLVRRLISREAKKVRA